MKLYYDLHIHSVLSPCADELMTPNNILNMALLKKLDIIAVTDHNSTKQLKVIEELKDSYDFLVIPGLEISVKEDFHMLAYFTTFADAHKFSDILEKYIIKEVFLVDWGREQVITDVYDNKVEVYPYLLTRNLPIGYKEVIELLKPFRHLLFFAHVNRDKYSGINYLNNVKLNGVEVYARGNYEEFIEKHSLKKYKIIHNSDAHQIININERETFNELELESKTIEAFFKHFNG